MKHGGEGDAEGTCVLFFFSSLAGVFRWRGQRKEKMVEAEKNSATLFLFFGGQPLKKVNLAVARSSASDACSAFFFSATVRGVSSALLLHGNSTTMRV